MLPHDIRDRIGEIFNDTKPSTMHGSVAHVPRPELIRQIESALKQDGKTPFLIGYKGVGKTSLRHNVTDRLLGPETVNVSFKRDGDIPGIELQRMGIHGAIREAIRNSRHSMYIEEPINSVANTSYAASAELLNKAQLLLIVESIEIISSQEILEDLFHFCNYLSDNTISYKGAKLLMIAAGLPELFTNQLRAVTSIDPITVSAWQDASMEAIIATGMKSCGLTILSSVEKQIVRLSCGIPRTLHYLVRETCFSTIDAGQRRRTKVTNQDFAKILRRDKIANLIDHIFPGISREILGLTLCQKALIGLAGRLGGNVSQDEAIHHLIEFWNGPEIREAFTSFLRMKENPFFVPELSSENNFICRDLRLSTVALLHIRLEAYAHPEYLKIYNALTNIARNYPAQDKTTEASEQMQQVDSMDGPRVDDETPEISEQTKPFISDSYSQGQLTFLRDILDDLFDDEDLRDMIFDLGGIDYGNLGGATKRGKARELVNELRKRGRISELIKEISQRRNNINWLEFNNS